MFDFVIESVHACVRACVRACMHACMPRRASLFSSVSQPPIWGPYLRGGRKIEWFNRDHDEYCDGMKRAYKVSRRYVPRIDKFSRTGRNWPRPRHPPPSIFFTKRSTKRSCSLSAQLSVRTIRGEVSRARGLLRARVTRSLLCALRIYFFYFYFFPFFFFRTACKLTSFSGSVLRCLHLR